MIHAYPQIRDFALLYITCSVYDFYYMVSENIRVKNLCKICFRCHVTTKSWDNFKSLLTFYPLVLSYVAARQGQIKTIKPLACYKGGKRQGCGAEGTDHNIRRDWDYQEIFVFWPFLEAADVRPVHSIRSPPLLYKGRISFWTEKIAVSVVEGVIFRFKYIVKAESINMGLDLFGNYFLG